MKKIIALVAILLTLSACSIPVTIGSIRDYQIDATCDNMSTMTMEIPVDASLNGDTDTKLESASEAKVTPDALATGAGVLGKLLIK